MNKSLLTLCLVAGLAACATSGGPSIQFSHPQHGVVGYNHPAFKPAEAACDAQVYGKGVKLGGQTYYSRQAFGQAYMSELKGVIIKMETSLFDKLQENSSDKIRNKEFAMQHVISNYAYMKCLQQAGFTEIKGL